MVTTTLGVADLVRRMEEQHAELEAAQDPRRWFLGTYLRGTRALAAALEDGTFEDPQWVARWRVALTDRYVRALAAFVRDPATAPPTWRRAFSAPADLPPEARVLLGMNVHINVDIPQSLLDVIPPEEFTDCELLARRRRDHGRVDKIFADRIAAEDAELQRAGGSRSPLDKAVAPLNRRAARRMLAEARRSAWANAGVLHCARLEGAESLARKVADLEVAGCERVGDLLRPGPLILRLALHGFGIHLPADPPPPWD
jgi:Family of unknown function (DUF5995)